MKYWKTSESKKGILYVILKTNAIIYCEAPKDVALRDAIEQNKLFKINTVKLIDLDAVLLDDTSNMLSLDYLQRGKMDVDIDIEPDTYLEIKDYFFKNFKGTSIQKYSFFKQSSWNIAGFVIALALTYYQYKKAVDIQINGIIEPKIRRGIFEELSFQVAKFLTPIGCIAVGGSVIAFFGYLIGKALVKPKEGKLFKLGGKSRMLIDD